MADDLYIITANSGHAFHFTMTSRSAVFDMNHSGEWPGGLNTDSDVAVLRRDLRLCISEELVGEAAAAGSRGPL